VTDTQTPDIGRLVDGFIDDSSNMSKSFKEDWTRSDYIEPLLGLLGWRQLKQTQRTTNSTGYVREEQIDAKGITTIPDYAMYVDGRRVFYVEAKKPSVKIQSDKKTAFQIREYGWNSGDPIGIVTDFEELSVYNCRIRPGEDNDAAIGRIQYLHCSEYSKSWQWLTDNFSPEAVRNGSLSRLADDFKPRKAMRQVDETLLADIERWRVDLATEIHHADPTLQAKDIDLAVQLTIDRILFLRVVEARGFEADGSLREAAQSANTYSALLDLFQKADTRYNSGLFHFRVESDRPDPDTLTTSLEIGPDVLRSIIHRLTDDDSPYLFDVMPADILGQMYEQMLGKVLTISHSGKLQLNLRPEVQKSGGVFYTPDFVVRHIVQQTLDPLLKGRTPNQVAEIKIVDPSCGSGSFLIGAYQYLLDWHLSYYANLTRPPATAVRRIGRNLLLTIEERKRILLNNIYGVDIDQQAVEVAKLSLLLKVVEGETQLSLAVDRLLPDLHSNIQCGNALIGTDFHSPSQLFALSPEKIDKVNAFDWNHAFPEISSKGGFDAVIGNPPWLMAGYYLADSKAYLQHHYSSWTGKADLYYLFLEKACRLCQPSGRIGMIVPSKFFHTKAAGEIRRILTEGSWVESIVDFGIAKIFKRATNYSCILQLAPESTGNIHITEAGNYFANPKNSLINRDRLGEATWHLVPEDRLEIWDEIASRHPGLHQLTERFGTGVQTGRDKLLLFDIDDPRVEDFDRKYLRPTLKGRSVRRFSVEPAKLMFFPYHEIDGQYELVDLEDLGDGLVKYLTNPDVEESLHMRLWFEKGPIELSGDWYGLMYVDHPWTFSRTHLVTPGIADRSNFAIGDGSIFMTGTAGVNSVVPFEGVAESPWYLLAVLNSRLISRYIVDHSTPYQGGYFKFSTNYIQDTPIRRVDRTNTRDCTIHDDLVELASGITSRKAQLPEEKGAARQTSQRVIEAAERQINMLVDELYQVDSTKFD
jgi:type I restriction-modification system DNA methylase subunit